MVWGTQRLSRILTAYDVIPIRISTSSRTSSTTKKKSAWPSQELRTKLFQNQFPELQSHDDGSAGAGTIEITFHFLCSVAKRGTA